VNRKSVLCRFVAIPGPRATCLPQECVPHVTDRRDVLQGRGVGSPLLKGVLEHENASRVGVQPFTVRGMARTVVWPEVQPFMGLP
jgi:hypothetical protein